ncbi:protein FAM83C-like [Pimephales promelas]|nr:protein FAM83C-like [Pimephales promelas]
MPPRFQSRMHGKLENQRQNPEYIKKPLNINSNKIELGEFISNPPPPPIDSVLDWEAMGVIRRFTDSPPDDGELQFYHRPLLDRRQGGWELPYNDFNSRLLTGHQEEGKFNSMFLSDFRHPEYQIQRRHYSPGETVNRHSQMPDRTTYPPLNPENEERYPVYKSRNMASEEEMRREPFLIRDMMANPEGTTQANLKKPSDLSRSKTFSTLSDILKRVNSRRTSLGQTRTENPTPGISKSTLELNIHRSDTPSNARTTNCDNLPLTPALALMKKRNDEVKSGLLRNMPSVFSPGFRPSSFSQQREPWRPPFRSHRSEEEH